jgi:hypothetical protein
VSSRWSVNRCEGMGAWSAGVGVGTSSETICGGVDGRSSGLGTSLVFSGEVGKNDVISGWEGEGGRLVLFDLGVAWDDSDVRLTQFEGPTSTLGAGTGTGFLNNSSYHKSQSKLLADKRRFAYYDPNYDLATHNTEYRHFALSHHVRAG